MCGILGTVPAFQDHSTFTNALNTLTHRGPDDSSILHLRDTSLGHRRLSILDLSPSGRQPMTYAEARYTLVFNGEIFNFIEIREELEKLGHSFKSTSDSEVVLAAYSEWGPKCLKRFNGMWAIAIWDDKDKSLFLSRDRFGEKPLFYHHRNGLFVFASEMKAILPFLANVRPSDNFKWMSENLFLYESTELCLIDGISRFPAGHYGTYKNGKLYTTRFWNTLDHLASPAKQYKHQVEEFSSIFFDSCKIRMRSDVPLGTALSGGLDSSAIIAVTTNLFKSHQAYGSAKPPKAFVASFPNSSIDETPYARKVIDHLAIDNEIVEINPLNEWKNIYQHIYQVEDIYLTSPIPMLMTYRAIKKGGVTVTIDGHGADELLSGYGHIKHALRDNLWRAHKIKEIYETILPGTDFSKFSITKDFIKFVAKESAKDLFGRQMRSIDSNHKSFPRDHFSAQLYPLFHETILPTLLRNYDRYSMASGVEIRMPFLDHRLVSYTFSLPATSKFGSGFTKSIIRDVTAPYLPPEITYRKTKIGFNSPMVEWMQGPLREYFLDLVVSNEFSTSELLCDAKLVRTLVQDICSKRKSGYLDGENAWKLLHPFFWEMAFLKGKATVRT